MDIEGQEGVPFLLVLHDLRTVLDVPSLRDIEARGGGEPVRLGLEPVVQWQEQLTVRCRDRDVIALIRVHRAVVREPRDVLVTLQIVGIRIEKRQIQDELVAVIDDLKGGAEVAVVEVPRDAGFELSTRRAGEPRVARAPVVAVEAPRIEPPVRTDRAVHVEVVAGQPPRPSVRHHAPAHLGAAGMIDQVDDRARSVGPEQRRARPAHHLHPLDVLIDPEQIVSVHEEGVHRGEHGHPVFQEHDVFDPQHAPHLNVLVYLTA